MQEMWVPSLGQEDPLRRRWLPTPVFLPREFHRQKILVDYSPWGRKRVGYNLVTKQEQTNQMFVYLSTCLSGLPKWLRG